MTFILAILVDLPSPMTYAKIQPKASSVLEKTIFKGFYHIWAWRPSWSMDRDHFSNFSFPQPKKVPYEIWAKLAQGFQRRSRLKMLTDGRTVGRKVITIAHLEHSSGELKKIAKIVPIGSLRLPPRWLSWKSILKSSWMKMADWLKTWQEVLGVTLRSKIAKIILIGNPR